MGVIGTCFRETIDGPTVVSWNGHDPGEVVGAQEVLQHFGSLLVGLDAQDPKLRLLAITPGLTLLG